MRADHRVRLGLADQFTWLALGRLVVQKDYPTMLAAFVEVSRRYPEAQLLIAGDGPLRGRCEAMIAELGLTENMSLLGLRADAPELLQAADGYVMSSAWEGLPIALLEAAASNLPIVTTAVGGNAEAVRDGISGFVVPPHDPHRLAAAMVQVMSLSDSERAGMGSAGESHIRDRYDLESVVDAWVSVFEKAASKRGLRLSPAS